MEVCMSAEALAMLPTASDMPIPYMVGQDFFAKSSWLFMSEER